MNYAFTALAATGLIDLEAVLFVGVCVMVFFFGICIGSFLNVCILRLPMGESLTKQNSHCMTCGTEIKRYDLIPLFSWLILGGKCRACKAPISPRYSIVEGLTGVIFVLTFVNCDFVNNGFLYPALVCLFIAGVIVVGFQDFDTQHMVTSVLFYIGIVAFATRVLSIVRPTRFRACDVTVLDGIIGFFCVSVPLLIIGFVITPLFYKLFVSEEHKSVKNLKKRLKTEKLSDKERAKLEKAVEEKLAVIKENGPVYGFGMGDILFMAASGLMLGWKACISATFIAIVLGATAAVIIKIKNSKTEGETDNAFAFGPFLAIGVVAALFFGADIFDWYVGLITVPEVM